MSLPPAVLEAVLPALERARGGGTSIRSVEAIGGGCINPSVRIETQGEGTFFLKWNADHPELFEPEAQGLRALAKALEPVPGLRVPRVHGFGESPGWLLLEFVPRGSAAAGYGASLGRGLAALHREGLAVLGRIPTDSGPGWGWERDNFIGSLPQGNGPASAWSDFWIERRLEPQLALAYDRRRVPGSAEAWQELFGVLPDLVGAAEADGPSLLHGDLWSGNVFAGADGHPVLVDPAVYRGHREVDLAMTDLFGGFPAQFYDAYEDAWPLRDGYREVRRSLYQLYPLLVHVNLFGAGYVARTEAALRRVLEAA